MSLIEKINEALNEINNNRIAINNAQERDTWNNGYDNGMAQGLVVAKAFILSEQKEPCEYCKGERYILDELLCMTKVAALKNNGKTIYCLSVNGEYQQISYCPMCGRPLNQPSTSVS